MDWSKVGEYIVGSIPAVVAVVSLLMRLDRKMGVFMIEHEMLMQHMAQNEGKELDDYPTRSRRPQ